MSGRGTHSQPRRRPPGLGRLAAFGALGIVLVIMVVPVVYVVLGSFMSEAEFREIPRHVFPRSWTLDNYATVSAGPLIQGAINTTLLAVAEVLGVVVSSVLAGYVFARKSFRGKEALFLFVLASAMVPLTMLVIPLYLTFTKLGLDNNYIGVLLPTIVSAFGIFMCRQFIRSIPQDYFDAAVIDGASDLRICWHVVTPMIRPQLTALAIFTIIGSVNSLLWPIVILSDPERATLAMDLLRYTQSGLRVTPFTETLAAAVLASLPLVFVFLVFQRGIIRGFGVSGLGGR